MIALLGILLLAADRIPLPADGRFEARPGKNVRVVVDQPAEIRVNGLYAGDTKGELDITGFLRTGVNEVDACLQSAGVPAIRRIGRFDVAHLGGQHNRAYDAG